MSLMDPSIDFLDGKSLMRKALTGPVSFIDMMMMEYIEEKLPKFRDLQIEYLNSIEEDFNMVAPLIHIKRREYACLLRERRNIVDKNMNNDEIETKLTDKADEIKQLMDEALKKSSSAPFERRFMEFVAPAVRIIGRDLFGLQEKFSIIRHDYGKLDFLRQNKEEEMFYSDNNIIEKIASFMSKNFNDKSSHRLMKAPFEYLSNVKLDTSVLQEFCSLLSKIFEEKNIEFIDPLCWKSRVETVTKGKSTSPSSAKKFDKVLIGVLEHDHFFSIHAHMNEHKIFIMDSMVGTPESYEKHLTNLVDYMLFHYEITKKHWIFHLVHNSPQQGNEVDCGVFMLKNMEYWAKEERLPFTRTQASAARHILMLEVVNGGLI